MVEDREQLQRNQHPPTQKERTEKIDSENVWVYIASGGLVGPHFVLFQMTLKYLNLYVFNYIGRVESFLLK